MITITWHLFIYIVAMIAPLVIASRIGRNWYIPLQWICAVIIDLIITAIYGGIVWW